MTHIFIFLMVFHNPVCFLYSFFPFSFISGYFQMLALEFTSFSFAWLSLMLGLGLSILSLCFEVTPPENTHKHSWNKQTKKALSLTSDFMGNLPKSCKPPSSRFFVFYTQKHVPVDTLWLVRIVKENHNYRSQKARLVFSWILGLWTSLWWIRSFFPFLQVLESICWVLRSDWCL